MNYSELGFVRVAAASPTVALADPATNVATILGLARQLEDEDVAVGLFPELCLSGYSTEDLFFSEALLNNSLNALEQLALANPLPLMVVGLPWRLADGRLLNCAAALSAGKVVGLVPKSVHPNYGEFYDQRWFVSGTNVNEIVIHETLGQFPIRVDQLMQLGKYRIGIEICEDLWAPEPPGVRAALAGAEIVLNLSASNELIAKADYRHELVRMSSAKSICAYVYASAGATESTKDVVYGGHCLAYENGQLLGQSPRFNLGSHSICVDIDCQRLRHDRAQNTTFAQAPRPRTYRTVPLASPLPQLQRLERVYTRHPFVPDDEAEVDARARDILAIQATGLARRMRAAHSEKLVIGLSGGLDSTLAFLVCLDALALNDLSLDNLVAITMPGPGTTPTTHTNAHKLTDAVAIGIKDIPIEAAVEQHLKDLEHDGAHDVVFENAQARERTQILFNYANKVGGLVVGTGDLSELALGWCTYNADQMASYNVNASVPKTLIAYLVRWYATHRASAPLAAILDDVLTTPISPELIPPSGEEISQHTEAIIGPYELHDFYLFHFLRNGATPTKIYTLCRLAFEHADDGYSAAEIKQWLRVFFQRFLTQQFKRTTLPPGPKVGSVSLSPRGDWRMPDETAMEPILAEIDQL